MAHVQLKRMLVAAIGVVMAGAVIALSPLQPVGLAAVQVSQTASASIAGAILDQRSQKPIDAAVVVLSGGTLRGSRQQTSDAKGRFEFNDLGPGEYYLSASHPGYFNGSYGRNSPRASLARPIVVASSSRFTDAMVFLVPPATLGGSVLDERGEPLAGLHVRLLSRAPVSGDSRWIDGPAVVTDSAGRFQFGGLTKGEYIVSTMSAMDTAVVGSRRRVIDESRPTMAHYLMYYPAARSSADALPIALEYGEDRAGVDFRLSRPKLHTVRGQISGPPGTARWAVVRLLPSGDESLCGGSEAGLVLAKGDGSFEFANVPSGRYVIRVSSEICTITFIGSSGVPLPARFSSGQGLADVDGLRIGWSTQSQPSAGSGPGTARETPGRSFWGESRVDVGNDLAGDLNGVVVSVRSAAEVRGLLTSTSSPIPPVTLAAEPVDGDPSMGRPWAEIPKGGDRFVLQGLMPAKYVLRLRAPLSWAIRSIQFRGSEYLDRPFDLAEASDLDEVRVVLAKGGVITGQVVDKNGHPDSRSIVVYFPTNPVGWQHFGFSSPRLGRVLPDSAGAYRIQGLPAGEYFLAAVDADDSLVGAWQTPAYLKTLSSVAVRMRIEWEAATSRNLQVVSVSR